MHPANQANQATLAYSPEPGENNTVANCDPSIVDKTDSNYVALPLRPYDEPGEPNAMDNELIDQPELLSRGRIPLLKRRRSTRSQSTDSVGSHEDKINNMAHDIEELKELMREKDELLKMMRQKDELKEILRQKDEELKEMMRQKDDQIESLIQMVKSLTDVPQ